MEDLPFTREIAIVLIEGATIEILGTRAYDELETPKYAQFIMDELANRLSIYKEQYKFGMHVLLAKCSQSVYYCKDKSYAQEGDIIIRHAIQVQDMSANISLYCRKKVEEVQPKDFVAEDLVILEIAQNICEEYLIGKKTYDKDIAEYMAEKFTDLVSAQIIQRTNNYKAFGVFAIVIKKAFTDWVTHWKTLAMNKSYIDGVLDYSLDDNPAYSVILFIPMFP